LPPPCLTPRTTRLLLVHTYSAMECPHAQRLAGPIYQHHRSTTGQRQQGRPTLWRLAAAIAQGQAPAAAATFPQGRGPIQRGLTLLAQPQPPQACWRRPPAL
ncbi:Hypothetical predicted protein, partial [Marmota monax]